jgi:psp operon transcriptional activator
MTREGDFRSDLYHRLSVFRLNLPPLREVMEDLDQLLPLLVAEFNAKSGRQVRHISEEVWNQLRAHDWPGNVRELRNVVERAVYRWDDPARAIGHIQFDPFESPWRPASPVAAQATGAAPGAAAGGEAPAPAPALRPDLDAVTDLRGAVDAHERAILEHHLGRNRYNQRQTAKALGLTYDQLRHCLKKHGLLERGEGA